MGLHSQKLLEECLRELEQVVVKEDFLENVLVEILVAHACFLSQRSQELRFTYAEIEPELVFDDVDFVDDLKLNLLG